MKPFIFLSGFVICLAAPTFAETILPAATLRLSCVHGDQARVEAEMASVQTLLEFAKAHDGEPVYLNAVIKADSGAGLCARDLAAPYKSNRTEGKPRRISFDGCKVEKGRSCVEKDMAQIDAEGPPLTYRHSVILPYEQSLPKGFPYRIGDYGDWLNYQGPFIARHYEGTGYTYATFHVPDAALSSIWERAVEMLKRNPADE